MPFSRCWVHTSDDYDASVEYLNWQEFEPGKVEKEKQNVRPLSRGQNIVLFDPWRNISIWNRQQLTSVLNIVASYKNQFHIQIVCSVVYNRSNVFAQGLESGVYNKTDR